MKDSMVVIYLFVFVLIGVVMIVLFTGSTNRDGDIRKLQSINLKQISPAMATQLKNGQKVSLNRDSVSVSKGGAGICINKIYLEENVYSCNFSITNGTGKSIRYVMYMAVQEQKKDGIYRDIIHLGDSNTSYLEIGSSKKYTQTFPIFKRHNKSNYRLYMQLMDSTTNSQQFVCDGAMPF